MSIKVNEIFYSLQGEGTLTGVPSVFIRLAGCPLRCSWCDTKQAWKTDAGSDHTIEQIIAEINKYNTNFVVITGGEPMISDKLSALCAGLNQMHKHITIETAGINYVPDLPVDLMSISPKLSNSLPKTDDTGADQLNYLAIDVLKKLVEDYPYQLKFVIEAESDIKEVLEVLSQLPHTDPAVTMLMPAAADRAEYIEKAPMIADLCKTNGFCFSPRLHIMLWDGKAGM